MIERRHEASVTITSAHGGDYAKLTLDLDKKTFTLTATSDGGCHTTIYPITKEQVDDVYRLFGKAQYHMTGG